jgi:hypothetical protein
LFSGAVDKVAKSRAWEEVYSARVWEYVREIVGRAVVVCSGCSGDSSMLWSDEVGGLLEIVEVGSRVGVPGKKGVASSQGDVL